MTAAAAYDSIAHTYGDGASAADGALAKARRAKPKRGMFSRGAPKNVYAAVDLYELMHLDFDAHVDVVSVAASVLLPMAQADRQLREQIERAREVLANPDRRAAYDKKSGVARRRAKALSAERRADLDGLSEAPTGETAGGPGDRSGASVADTEEHDAEREASADRRAAAGAASASDPGPDADANASGQDDAAPDGRSARRGFGLGSLFARNELTPEMIEAENGRVLSLADEDEVWNVPDAGAAPSASAERMTPATKRRETILSFVKGPRAGEAVSPDAANEMRAELAGAGGGVQIRVWRSAGVYLLQQLVGPPVLIGGAYIEAPVVVLEDGDEIESGDHVLRFQSPE